MSILRPSPLMCMLMNLRKALLKRPNPISLILVNITAGVIAKKTTFVE